MPHFISMIPDDLVLSALALMASNDGAITSAIISVVSQFTWLHKTQGFVRLWRSHEVLFDFVVDGLSCIVRLRRSLLPLRRVACVI